MTSPKLTRQQIVLTREQFDEATHCLGFPDGSELLASVFVCLVRNGLAKGARDEGRYQVRWKADGVWQEAVFSGEYWWTPRRPQDNDNGSMVRELYEPAVVGPRIITPPEER